jgi:hypothetical protein
MNDYIPAASEMVQLMGDLADNPRDVRKDATENAIQRCSYLLMRALIECDVAVLDELSKNLGLIDSIANNGWPEAVALKCVADKGIDYLIKDED